MLIVSVGVNSIMEVENTNVNAQIMANRACMFLTAYSAYIDATLIDDAKRTTKTTNPLEKLSLSNLISMLSSSYVSAICMIRGCKAFQLSISCVSLKEIPFLLDQFLGLLTFAIFLK